MEKDLLSWKHTNMTDDRNENQWFYNRQQWMIMITNSDNFSQRSHFSLGLIPRPTLTYQCHHHRHYHRHRHCRHPCHLLLSPLPRLYPQISLVRAVQLHAIPIQDTAPAALKNSIALKTRCWSDGTPKSNLLRSICLQPGSSTHVHL